ncbi:hypothetical protein AAFF_G00070970 [Aldrovandia affinis]|uniref:TNFR-Cys domain-containing protein n=1 Tax=Aldrovandia affinis TaxID=143900 RepID=A0AAD7WDN2_9TELE|nr:hypothetical protein AAFF_G00070970 [Aldrovandia affinis]
MKEKSLNRRTSRYFEVWTVPRVRMALLFLCLEMLTLMSHVISALPTGHYIDDAGRQCQRCPPGQYQFACNICSACQSGSFTDEWNIEESCLPCNRDCRNEFNLRVVKNCSRVSDVVCSCIAGFTCKDSDSAMSQCKYCDVDTSPSLPPGTASILFIENKTETPCAPGTFLNVSSGNCDPHTNSESQVQTKDPTHSPETEDRQLWQYVGPVIFLVVVLAAIGIIFIWRQREGTCLKQFFKLCSHGGHKEENDTIAHQTGEAAGQLFSKETHWNANSLTNHNMETHIDLPISIDQAPKATGNLGPFHIHSAGAVFVSLLNHFANPERETEGEEERDGEKDCIFFPSQEQGKESHLSKEEEM